MGFLDFAPFLKVISNCLSVSYATILLIESCSNAYVKNKSLYVFAKQNKKKKNKQFCTFKEMSCMEL